MICQWQSILGILPPWMRQQVDDQGSDTLQELRLRLGQLPELCLGDKHAYLKKAVTSDDLRYVMNVASRYSPWACASVSSGYITIPGGHRLGISGDMVQKQGSSSTFRWVSSLCLRISRDFPGISRSIENRGSILIVGPPGSGKTTLLRDLIRTRADTCTGSVAVVDERMEIFPVSQDGFSYSLGKRTDVLTGCPKNEGIEMALRCLGPATIAMDEITARKDCQALMNAAWCGVSLLATAHAGSRAELYTRPVYKPILENKLFDTLVLLHQNQSYHTERMT